MYLIKTRSWAFHWSADKRQVAAFCRPRPPVSHPITAWNTSSKTPEQTETLPPAVCSLWRQCCVCLGQKWIFEEDGRVLPALYWKPESMLSLWRESTACALPGGLYPVCCRFMSVCISSSSARICFVDLAWTPNLVPWGASEGIDLKLRPESVSSEHAHRLRLIIDTVCNVELGLNIQIKLQFGAQSRKKSPYSRREKRLSYYSQWQIRTEYNIRSQTEIWR